MIKTVSGINTGYVPDDPDEARRFAFSQAIDDNRDQWGRPKIMLPDGSRETGYRRASSYGSPLEDDSQLVKWKMRQVARGVARRPDIGLAITRAEVGLEGAPAAAKKAKGAINELCEQAMEVVESGAKASIGTSLHHICEKLDLGKDPGHVPDQWRPDVDAYRDLVRGFRMLSVERFVVQDDHRVAGTTDRVVEVTWPLLTPAGTIIDPGAVLIGDVKTSQSMDFAGCKFGVQCWIYATGVPYDPIAKQRIEWGHDAPRTDWALIFHAPSGQGKAKLYWVDLTTAEEAAHDVREIYLWRNKRGKALIEGGRPGEDFTETCARATGLAELKAAYQRAVAVGSWNEVLKARFGRRKLELAEAEQVAQ